MVRKRIKFKSSKLGEKKKEKKINQIQWWIEDINVELDDIEHTYFINRELRRVK